MSKPNEPPLALDSWRVKVKLNDGDDFDLYPEDFSETTRNNIIETVSTYTDNYIDHLKGKYGQEIEQAENLHAQNSERFVEDALNPLGKYKLVDEKKSD